MFILPTNKVLRTSSSNIVHAAASTKPQPSLTKKAKGLSKILGHYLGQTHSFSAALSCTRGKIKARSGPVFELPTFRYRGISNSVVES